MSTDSNDVLGYRVRAGHAPQETIDRAIEIERAYLGNRTIRQIGFFKSVLVVPISMTALVISVAYTIPFRIWRKLTGRGGGIPSMDSAQLLAFKAAMSS